jgi:hypothetical protein
MSGYVSGKTSLTTVQTGNIAANAVTLAKMAGGTDGNLITYDASGDPAAVATGSDGEVLTSAGAGQPPAFEAGGPSQATQAALEAETNENTYAAPDLLKYSPGVAKAWIKLNQTSTQAINASHNVTSITDNGVGFTIITWNIDFSSADYSATGMNNGTRSLCFQGTDGSSIVAGTVQVQSFNSAGTTQDAEMVCVTACGDQA